MSEITVVMRDDVQYSFHGEEAEKVDSALRHDYLDGTGRFVKAKTSSGMVILLNLDHVIAVRLIHEETV